MWYEGILMLFLYSAALLAVITANSVVILLAATIGTVEGATIR
jgi:hypothetical protein